METSESEIIESTKNWIREIVIGLNFCPFAAKPFKADLIEYRVDDSDELAASLETFIASCHYLENNPELETGLVIYSQGYSDFEDYLNLVELAEKLLIDEVIFKENLEDIFGKRQWEPAEIVEDKENEKDSVEGEKSTPIETDESIENQSESSTEKPTEESTPPKNETETSEE